MNDEDIEEMYFINCSGKRIYINRLSYDDISLKDIAHHLTKECRYSGALPLDTHYSVANHCITLYYYCFDRGYSRDVQRAALMHDAAEAYLKDMNGVIKPYLRDYMALEAVVHKKIMDKYCIKETDAITKIVKDLDKRILLDEGKKFFPQYYDDFKGQYCDLEPLGINVISDACLELTKSMFLHCCSMEDIYD